MNAFSLEPLESSSMLGEQLALLLGTMTIETIKLPGCPIELGGVTIKRPVTLIGSPGTQIIVQKAPMAVKPGIAGVVVTVKFIECTFILRLPFQTSSGPAALFKVDTQTSLELQDCQLKVEEADPAPAEAPTQKPDAPETVAVVVLGATPNSSQPALSGTVKLTSCSLFAFKSAVAGEDGSQVQVSRCSFIKAGGTVVTAKNPLRLAVEGCNFESPAGCAVEIKYDAEKRPGQAASVRIDHNIFTESKCGAVRISSDRGDCTPVLSLDCEVTITENQIQGGAPDGICVKNLGVTRMSIANNTISEVVGNGISLALVHCPAILLSRNVVQQCTGFGIYLMETSCKLAACECNFNRQSGFSIMGCVTPNASLGNSEDKGKDIELKDCVARSNKQHGVSVLDFYNGQIRIEKCEIENNHENGVWLNCGDSLTSAINMSVSMASIFPAGAVEGRVEVHGGEIKFNRLSGIYVGQQPITVDATVIKGNFQFGIHLPTKKEERFLKLTRETVTKQTIQGTVGGAWGRSTLYPTGSICACCFCSII